MTYITDLTIKFIHNMLIVMCILIVNNCMVISLKLLRSRLFCDSVISWLNLESTVLHCGAVFILFNFEKLTE